MSIKIDKNIPVPHFRQRKGEIKYIIIHCSRSNPLRQTEIMQQNGVSAHYIIGRDGSLTEVIKETDVAYHAGISNWHQSAGQSLNETSVGIELECPTMGQKKRSYYSVQINRLIELLKYLQQKYHIRKDHILAHSDIAPMRKADPGAWFPWKKLYKEGLVFWYNENSLSKETDEEELLKIIGYDTANLFAARYAFCRRWLEEEVLFDNNMQHLLDNPFPPHFKPKDQKKYLKRLRAVASAIEKIRHP